MLLQFQVHLVSSEGSAEAPTTGEAATLCNSAIKKPESDKGQGTKLSAHDEFEVTKLGLKKEDSSQL